MSFNSFSRAFFSDPDRLSTAELIKSFHFYYLSQDCGLLYDYPDDHYERGLLGPIRQHLETHGVTVRLDTAVSSWERTETGFEVNGEPFDAVVLATDVVGASRLAQQATWLDAWPETARQLRGLRAGQRYAVIRVWFDQAFREDIAEYVVVDRRRALDAVALYHRLEKGAAAWRDQTGEAVVELHCYAVPDDLPDAELMSVMVEEFYTFFPDARQRNIVRHYEQIRNDFAAYHKGLHKTRPTPTTEVPGLTVAGDWVKLPMPATLMEAAFTSGLLAANALLKQQGVQGAPIWSVPQKGVLVGLPEAPGKRRVDFDA